MFGRVALLAAEGMSYALANNVQCIIEKQEASGT